MHNYICRRCGVEFTESEEPPESCPICLDPREAVAWDGQQWTTMGQLKSEGFTNDLREEEPGLLGIGTTPSFSIGQRALLVQTSHGNVLFDCISLLDESTIVEVEARGGIRYISLSHPHFYDTMVTWSRAFDDAEIVVPEADRQHVMRPDPAIRYWDGSPRELVPGVTLIKCGGHFEGSAVLHWAEGAGGKGALLVGDTMAVVPDRRYVSFMTSYPNLIPLSRSEVVGIVDAVEPYLFDRIYGGWWGRAVASGGKESVRSSARRYIKHITG